MIRYSLCVLCALCATLSFAAEPVAEIVTVQSGVIYPSNIVATITEVAAAQAGALAAAAQAEAVDAAAAMVADAVAGVNEVVNSLEGIGYIRGHVLQFGAGVTANTNATASIVKFASAGTTESASLWDIWTYFTEDPGALPVMRFSDSIGRTNSWDNAPMVGDAVLDEVLAGGTLYEAYKIRVAMPLEYETAFFRTFVDVSGAGTNAVYMPVRNGVAVNGVAPLTATFIDGTNTYRFVGGIRVQ